MNKLETITQLLVNELADFQKNVQQLGNQMERAESLRVKFDLSPIKGLISQLEEFSKRETERREHYLDRLERNLEQAKIYPKWAVITYISTIFLAFGVIIYSVYTSLQFKEIKEQAFKEGISTYEAHMTDFFNTHPKSNEAYQNWLDKKN